MALSFSAMSTPTLPDLYHGTPPPVVFLDIDGVLITPSGMRDSTPNPSCVACLNTIIRNSGADIVVSSTWRHMGLSALTRQLRAWDVQGYIRDITPDLSAKKQVFIAVERGAEIQAWLDRNHVAIGDVVILDDDADMGALLPRLVQTNPLTGLTPADAQQALALLKKA